MGGLKPLAFAGVLVAGLPGAAVAADLLPPAPAFAPPAPIDIGGEWYLRGDVGVGIYDAKLTQPTVIQDNGRFLRHSIGDATILGFGAGYQFNSWFRADITGEYRTAVNVSGVDQVNWWNDDTYMQVNNFYRGQLSSAVFLANGYVDLGTWYGLTPYVGAGIGFAYNMMSGFTDNGIVTYGDGFTSPSGGSMADGHKTSLAWALMAGLSYDVSPNLKLDFNYRYMHLGDAQTGTIYCLCGGTDLPLRTKDITSQDIRIGMRWMLSPPVMAAAEPPPLVRKY